MSPYKIDDLRGLRQYVQAYVAITTEALTARLTMTSSSLPPDKTPGNRPADARKDSLIEYPSQFPIKVMGAKVDGFVQALTTLAQQFDPAFDASTIEMRDSRAGNYLGVTLTITATSREQLDNLYRALSSHPMVKVVL